MKMRNSYRLSDSKKKRTNKSRVIVFHEKETMSDSAVLEKTDEPGSKVDFTSISLPKQNTIERGEF